MGLLGHGHTIRLTMNGGEAIVEVDVGRPAGPAKITFEDGTEFVYGDSSNVLKVDEMFLITLNPPSK